MTYLLNGKMVQVRRALNGSNFFHSISRLEIEVNGHLTADHAAQITTFALWFLPSNGSKGSARINELFRQQISKR